ncbi:hypothetical protein V6N13_013543 [Hibiscus sabdariffa]
MKLLVKAKDHLDHILSHGDSVKVHEEDDHVERWSQESPKVINANCNTSSKSQTSGDLKISSVLAPSINNLEKVTIFAKSEMEPNSKLPEFSVLFDGTMASLCLAFDFGCFIDFVYE